MDSQSQDQQQKDFLSSLFPLEPVDHLPIGSDAQHQAMSMFQFNGAPPAQIPTTNMHVPIPQGPNGQVMDLLGSMLSVPGIDNQIPNASQAGYNPQLLLEQQFKLTQLQQLQQLQNQIFQQQIALISGQASGITTPIEQKERPSKFQSLPTPGSSTELRAQQPTEYVSPMTLHYMDTPQDNGYPNHGMDNLTPLPNHSMHTQYGAPRGSTSAPAHIAFQTSPSHPTTSDLDFDISPLTSPWLGAHQQSGSLHQTSNKRTASPSGDELSSQPSRKKPSPAIRPTNPMSTSKKITRGSKSTNSTPLLRSSRSRKGSTAGDVIGDTPSPVDLSMPPPAPPANQISSSSASSSSASLDKAVLSSPNPNAQLTPVTPASIMNLGRLGINSGLAPLNRQSNPSRPVSDSFSRNKSLRKAGSLVSPTLKTILPAGGAPPPSVSQPHPQPQPIVQVRKTSHKAAEQKRRDSLKTTFDDLRGLLPPIPLPSEEKFPDEPILPGALPPRGPPKAGGEGPNKSVSKLQLLIYGNDYIRMLKGRVQRRDEEIEKLRKEVLRFRDVLGSEAASRGGGEEVDLERDLDAVEAFSTAFGRASAAADDDADAEGDD